MNRSLRDRLRARWSRQGGNRLRNSIIRSSRAAAASPPDLVARLIAYGRPTGARSADSGSAEGKSHFHEKKKKESSSDWRNFKARKATGLGGKRSVCCSVVVVVVAVATSRRRSSVVYVVVYVVYLSRENFCTRRTLASSSVLLVVVIIGSFLLGGGVFVRFLGYDGAYQNETSVSVHPPSEPVARSVVYVCLFGLLARLLACSLAR